MIRGVGVAVVGLALVWLGYRLFVLQPSNERNWEYGMDVLPHVTLHGSVVHVSHLRDYRWSENGPVSSDYLERSFDVDHLERVWFVEEPFTIAPFQFFDGVAHTYFVFDFKDQPPVAVSVESRREHGQGYDPARGLVNEYELIYVWGTEQDVTGRRAVLERNQLYMYPLVGSMDTARSLFLDLAMTTQQLETQPRFYNTFSSNCTNELAKAANRAEPGAIPLNIALVFPGYSDRVLYDAGYLPRDAPLETLRQRYAIRELVTETIDRPDFSDQLRLRLGQEPI
jgi:hypothetical protein